MYENTSTISVMITGHRNVTCTAKYSNISLSAKFSLICAKMSVLVKSLLSLSYFFLVVKITDMTFRLLIKSFPIPNLGPAFNIVTSIYSFCYNVYILPHEIFQPKPFRLAQISPDEWIQGWTKTQLDQIYPYFH